MPNGSRYVLSTSVPWRRPPARTRRLTIAAIGGRRRAYGPGWSFEALRERLSAAYAGAGHGAVVGFSSVPEGLIRAAIEGLGTRRRPTSRPKRGASHVISAWRAIVSTGMTKPALAT